MIIRNLTGDHIPFLRTMIDPLEPEVEPITDFTWMIVHRYFQNLCFVAEVNSEIVGFVTAVQSSVNIDTVYLWQIRILPDLRRNRIAFKLVSAVVEKARDLKASYLEFSVDPSNLKTLALAQDLSRFFSRDIEKIDRITYKESQSGKLAIEEVYRGKL